MDIWATGFAPAVLLGTSIAFDVEETAANGLPTEGGGKTGLGTIWADGCWGGEKGAEIPPLVSSGRFREKSAGFP